MTSQDNGTPSWGARADHRVLNKDTRRLSGPEKVKGEAIYSIDRHVPDMLYGKLVCIPVAKAEFTVDVDPAMEIEGVVIAIPLREGSTLYNGQAVAAVAAETPELAEDGARAVVVNYTPQGFVVTAESAKAPGAPQVSSRSPNHAPRGGSNDKGRGDMDATMEALDASDFVVEAEFDVAIQHHACLETHGLLADFKGGDEATIYASTQVAFGIPGSAAGPLGLDRQNVRCVVEHMGGGFGAKFSMDVAGRAACLMAAEVGRPVSMFNDRRQEFETSGNRSGSIQRIKAGVAKDGEILAMHSDMDKLGGVGRGPGAVQPYIYNVLESFTLDYALHTNTDSSRAMRAPGHPQVSFAMESVVDMLAYGIGADLVEIRKRNLSDPAYHRQLDRVAQEIGWNEHQHRTAPGKGDGWIAEGIGFGVSTWGGGGGPGAAAEVRIERDGGVTSSIGVQDLGTGVRTLVAMIPAEEFGLQASDVLPRIGDTQLPNGVGSGGSVTTASVAPCLKDASHKTRLAFAEHLASVLKCEAKDVTFADGKVFAKSAPDRGLTWKDACATLPAEGLARTGKWIGDLQTSGAHGAQAARVQVDLMTGAVKVLKMVAVQDSGLVLNPLTWRSQVNGAMIQSIGLALYEGRVMEPDLGIQINANLGDYKLPGCMEIPELVAIVDDEDTRQAVIGVGEPPAIPGAGAIANAIHNACGARITSLPITPDKVLEALAKLS